MSGFGVRTRCAMIALAALLGAGCETTDEMAGASTASSAGSDNSGELFAILGAAAAGAVLAGAGGGDQAAAAAAIETMSRAADPATAESVYGGMAAAQAQQVQQAQTPALQSGGSGGGNAYPGSGSVVTHGGYGAAGGAPVTETAALGSRVPGHDPNKDATNCIQPHTYDDGRAVLKNICPYPVEATWCLEGVDCNPGYSSQWTIRANSQYTVIGGKGRNVRYAACEGANSMYKTTQMSANFQHACR